MDDLAEKLSASKKTIYQYFKDKRELVNVVSLFQIEEESKQISGIRKVRENAIEEMFKMSIYMRDMHTRINPTCIYDIKKYYPKAWQNFQNFETNFIKSSVIENLNHGIKEGLYRSEINTEILARLKIAEIETGFNQEHFPMDRFNPFDVQVELFEHFLAGIVTKKGSELLNHYKNQ